MFIFLQNTNIQFFKIITYSKSHFQATLWLLVALSCCAAQQYTTRRTSSPELQEPPEGYFAFEEAPNAEPPRVRRPPYLQTDVPCAGECRRPRDRTSPV